MLTFMSEFYGGNRVKIVYKSVAIISSSQYSRELSNIALFSSYRAALEPKTQH